MRAKKLKNIAFNNRKKELVVTYQNGDVVYLHYAQLKLKDNVQQAGVDPESGGLAFFVETQRGDCEFIPYDVPLVLTKDPDYLFQMELEELLVDIKQALKKKGLSKKFLARSLATSDMQIERLLNPHQLNKNFVQLNKIAHILGLNLKLRLKQVA